MISYELAKKLKDAGFPVRVEDIGEITWRPTLEELIEVVGNLIPYPRLELSAPKETCEGDEYGVTCGWIATALDKRALAITPEEAVANLYLELNKK